MMTSLYGYMQHLPIWAPHRACYCGTLLCLGADELVFGAMVELNPRDHQISSAGSLPLDAPCRVLTEGIRSFRRLAKVWFSVQSEENWIQILILVAQRTYLILPILFHRSDRLVRHVAVQLLMSRLLDSAAVDRQSYTEKLIGGIFVHDHIPREPQHVSLTSKSVSPHQEWRRYCGILHKSADR